MVEADLSFEGAIVLELCPAVATCCLHLVVAFPGELDGVAFASAMDGTCGQSNSNSPRSSLNKM